MNDNENLDSLAPGTLIQEFKILRRLGQGAFAIVYLAENQYLPQTVAIKEFFHAELARRTSDGTVAPRSDSVAETYRWALSKFLEEAQILYELGQPDGHPNIVKVHRFHEANGTAYMVMDYEEGESLEDRLEREGTLAEPALSVLLSPLLDALGWSHSKSIWHRDIKPANILVRPDESPVLMDFGAARKERGDGAVSQIAVFTPNYAAPEQESGLTDTMGPWTDIYSLGATVYRAVVGRPPTNASQRAMKADHATAAAAAQGQGYTDEFLAAINHALELRPEDRPQTVAEWRKDFQQVRAFARPLSDGDTVIRPLPAIGPSQGDDQSDRSSSVPARRHAAELSRRSDSARADAPEASSRASSRKRLAYLMSSVIAIGLATIGTIAWLDKESPIEVPAVSRIGTDDGSDRKPNTPDGAASTTPASSITEEEIVKGLAPRNRLAPPATAPSGAAAGKVEPAPPGALGSAVELAKSEPPAAPAPRPDPDSVLTPAPTPDPGAVLASARELVRDLECASLVVERDGDARLTLFGFLMTQRDLDGLVRQLSALDHVSGVDHDDVRILAKPFCQVVGVLNAHTAGPVDGLSIELVDSDGTYREGQFLELDAGAASTFDGYLYVDYIDGEGNVLHFLPSRRMKNNVVAAGQKILLGRKPKFEVGPPHGESMFIAISSEQPLFDAIRSEIEPIEEYLPALETSLQVLSAKSGIARRINSTTRFIVTTQ